MATEEIPKEKLLWMYKTMVRIRVHEERVAELFAKGKVPGFVHLYVGEEAVATDRKCRSSTGFRNNRS